MGEVRRRAPGGGRKGVYAPCRYCGRPINRTAAWRGWHEGCTRRRRNYPAHQTDRKLPRKADPALLAACEAELERWWIENGWGVRPPSVIA